MGGVLFICSFNCCCLFLFFFVFFFLYCFSQMWKIYIYTKKETQQKKNQPKTEKKKARNPTQTMEKALRNWIFWKMQRIPKLVRMNNVSYPPSVCKGCTENFTYASCSVCEFCHTNPFFRHHCCTHKGPPKTSAFLILVLRAWSKFHSWLVRSDLT